jgi:Tfp pilus assembly ATPase PilU
MSIDFAAVLGGMVEQNASDVHLSPGVPPAMRLRGQITPM